jgi:hypothetical protein
MRQIAPEPMTALPAVSAEMNYLGDPFRVEDGADLHYYADFTGTTNVRLAPAPVTVRDARTQADQFTLDRQGFVVARAPTVIRNFEDADAIAAQYLDECEALIRQITGAVRTFSTDTHCRFDGVVDPTGRYDNQPTRFVHADFSAQAAERYGQWAPFAVSDYPRFAIYNLWRVVTPPPQSMPLAVCDARSLEPADEVESIVIMGYPNREHVATHTMLYHPRSSSHTTPTNPARNVCRTAPSSITIVRQGRRG